MSHGRCQALGVFERKMLRKIFGPKRVGDDYRMSSSTTWMLLSVLIAIAGSIAGGHRRVGRPRTRWKDQVKEALTSLGVTNWRRRAQSRGAWREALRQAETR